MTLCPDNQQPVLGQCPPGQAIDIDCVPQTNGQPNYTPAPDQVPFAYDSATGVLWIHVCPDSWVPFQTGLCALPSADITSVANPCTSVNIPVTFDNAGVCDQGTVTLGNLAAEIALCLGLGNPPPSTIVLSGTDITVSSNTVNNTTTYTIDYTGNPSLVTQVVTNGNVIATHDDGSGNVTDIEETVTTLTSDGAGGFIYRNERGDVTNIPSATRSQMVDRSTGTTLNAASPTTLRKRIATHLDGAGVNQDIFESVSTMIPTSDGNTFAYTDELGRTTVLRLPQGVIVWRSAASATGVGSLTATQRALVVNDPNNNFNLIGPAAAFTEIEILQAGRYAIGNQAGLNNSSNTAAGLGGSGTPTIMVNGLLNANLPGPPTGSPYPQNHNYFDPNARGQLHTTHLVTFLGVGDTVRGSLTVSRTGTYDVTEGYIYYLGA